MGGGKANTTGVGNSRFLEGRGPAKPGHCKPEDCKAGHCTIGQRHGYDKRNLVKKQILTGCCHACCGAFKMVASCCKACCTQFSGGRLVHPIKGTEPLKLDQNSKDSDDASE